MKQALLVILFLLASTAYGYCDNPSLQVELTTPKSEIFVGEGITATIEITNTGTADLQFPSPGFGAFSSLLTIDNPHLRFSSGVSLISVGGQVPQKTLKPGEKITDKIYVTALKMDDQQAPLIFKIGFKPSETADFIWSNAVTMTYKDDEDLPVLIETSLKDDTINIADIQNFKSANAHLRITNASDSPQYIGMDGACCVRELNSLISDNDAIKVISAAVSCLSSMCAMGDVNLQPGQVYEQDVRINYMGEDPSPQPITFHIGIKSIGHNTVWGNPLTVTVVGGTEEWQKHMIYLKNFAKESQMPPPENGTVKRYYENSQIMDEHNYKDGKLNGPIKRYYQNGQLQAEVNYVDNKKDGIEKIYSENGQLVSQKEYKDGKWTSEEEDKRKEAERTLNLQSGCANCGKPGEFQRVVCDRIGVNWVDNRIIPLEQYPDVPTGIYVEDRPEIDASDPLTRMPPPKTLKTKLSEKKTTVHYGVGEAVVFGPLLGPEDTGFGADAICSPSGIVITARIRHIHHPTNPPSPFLQKGKWRPVMVVTFVGLRDEGDLGVRWARYYDDGAADDELKTADPDWAQEKIIRYKKPPK